MKKFQAPDGSYITIPDGRVSVFGLSQEEIAFVRKCTPNKEFEVYSTNCATDLLAVDSVANIIRASKLPESEFDLLVKWFREINGCTDLTLFWLGEPKLPKDVRGNIQYYNDFHDVMESLKYRLLSAHRKVNKTRTFSKNISDCLLILSLIRSHPGIRSQDIADKIELPLRTVQRHIATLQATGEWIDYDSSKRGWYLMDGVSILYGDHIQNWKCEDCEYRREWEVKNEH